MTSISKNVCIDKLANIVNNYYNTCHCTIKMKLVDTNSSTYTDFDKKNNKEDPKFKTGDKVRISTHKNTFAKGYVNGHKLLAILMMKKLLEHFTKKPAKRKSKIIKNRKSN